jgi:hypothetical protein
MFAVVHGEEVVEQRAPREERVAVAQGSRERRLRLDELEQGAWRLEARAPWERELDWASCKWRRAPGEGDGGRHRRGSRLGFGIAIGGT